MTPTYYRISLLKILALIFGLFNLAFDTSAQKQSFGTWTDLNSFKNCVDVVATPEYVVAAFPTAVSVYNMQSNELQSYSKSTGLSGVDIISCSQIETHEFAIGYQNGLIDVIDLQEERIKTVSDIFTASFFGDKSINTIKKEGDLLYAATGFGIVVFIAENKFVKETYRFGASGANIFVNDLAIFNDTIWAATDEGLFYAAKNNPLLTDYNSWTKDASLPTKKFSKISPFNANLLVIEESSGPANDRVLYRENGVWLALITLDDFVDLAVNDNKLYIANSYNNIQVYSSTLDNISIITGGIEKPFYLNALSVNTGGVYFGDKSQGLLKAINSSSIETINAKGPLFQSPWQVKYLNNKLYTVAGGVTASFNNAFLPLQYSVLSANTWENTSKIEVPFLPEGFDAIDIEPNAGKVYLATMGLGLVEVSKTESKLYTSGNSLIEPRPEDANYFAISALATDTNGNLWIANSLAQDLLKVKTPSNNWYSFNLGVNFGVRNLAYIEKIVPTSNGYKWLVKPRGNGLHVFYDNGTLEDTSDDLNRSIGEGVNEGSLPSASVYDVAEDKSGTVWVGTEQGIVAFFAANNVFTDENLKAEQIFIEQDGNVQIVLETERVNRIIVDGANRKWVGTQNSGVFLYSPDFKEVLANYTADNSSLFSNQVSDMTMDQKNGLLYVVSSAGLQTFQTDATEGPGFVEEIQTFPNPARLGLDDKVVVKGLSYQTLIRVTNATGNLVAELESNGGIAIWNLQNSNGEVQGPGVYYFFAALKDGSSSNVGKVLLIAQ